MNKKILIIEDDQFMERMAAKKLQEKGYSLLVAQNGEEAVKLLQTETPDMILLDLLLPGTIDGFEVLRQVRASDKLKNVPVLVFSNLSDEASIKKASDLGVKGYLVKSSVTLNELTDRIDKIF